MVISLSHIRLGVLSFFNLERDPGRFRHLVRNNPSLKSFPFTQVMYYVVVGTALGTFIMKS